MAYEGEVMTTRGGVKNGEPVADPTGPGPEYEIICSEALWDLAQDTQKYLNDGWSLHGGFVVVPTEDGGIAFAQAIVR